MPDAARAKPNDETARVSAGQRPGRPRRIEVSAVLRGAASIFEIQPDTILKRLKHKGFEFKMVTEDPKGNPLAPGILNAITRLDGKVKTLQVKHVYGGNMVAIEKAMLVEGFASDWKKITGDIVVTTGKLAPSHPAKKIKATDAAGTSSLEA